MKVYEDEEGPDVALRKLTQQFGVLGYVVLNNSGVAVKYHGMDGPKALQYAALVSELALGTQEFLSNEAGPAAEKSDQSELVTIRLKTRKHEIIVAPEGDFTLVVIHDANYVEPAQKAEEVAA